MLLVVFFFTSKGGISIQAHTASNSGVYLTDFQPLHDLPLYPVRVHAEYKITNRRGNLKFHFHIMAARFEYWDFINFVAVYGVICCWEIIDLEICLSFSVLILIG